MLEKETSAYFNGTVKQLSLLLVRRVLVFIIRVKCRREHLTQVARARSHLYFEIHLLSFLYRAIRKNSPRRDSNTDDFL